MTEKKYQRNLLILNGNPIQLLENDKIHHGIASSAFFDKIAEFFESIVLVAPHRDLVNNRKLNVVRKDNITYYLIPFYSDPIDFFKKLVFNLYPALKGMWLALGRCDVCLLMFPNPFLPFIYTLALLRRKKIVLFAAGTWVVTARHLKPGLSSYLKKAMVFLYERFHLFMVKRYPTITTHPYLNLNLQHVQFGFTSKIKAEEIPPYRKPSLTRKTTDILFVGRLSEAKGIFVLLEAFKQIRAKRDDITLHIVGDGYLSENVRKFVDENNLNSSVFMYGKVKWDTIKNMYAQMNIFVLSSYTEGVPNVVFEAMYHSLPVVATRVGAMSMLFRDKAHCLLVESNNVTELRDAIEYFIENPSIATEMAKRAYDMVAQYHLENTVAHMAEFINEGCLNGIEGHYEAVPHGGGNDITVFS